VPLVIFCVSALLLLSALYLFCSPRSDPEQGEEEAPGELKKKKEE
jgi:hypothetical protein